MKENLYVNKIDKELRNNETVYYSKNKVVNKITKSYNYNDVKKKIKEIFNAPDFVYKADVEIKLENKTINKTIIAKNNTYLITDTNETIKISDIKDIKKSS